MQWFIIWILTIAGTYDFYMQNNDISCLYILLIPFFMQIVYKVCDTVTKCLKYQNKIKGE